MKAPDQIKNNEIITRNHHETVIIDDRLYSIGSLYRSLLTNMDWLFNGYDALVDMSYKSENFIKSFDRLQGLSILTRRELKKVKGVLTGRLLRGEDCSLNVLHTFEQLSEQFESMLMNEWRRVLLKDGFQHGNIAKLVILMKEVYDFEKDTCEFEVSRGQYEKMFDDIKSIHLKTRESYVFEKCLYGLIQRLNMRYVELQRLASAHIKKLKILKKAQDERRDVFLNKLTDITSLPANATADYAASSRYFRHLLSQYAESCDLARDELISFKSEVDEANRYLLEWDKRWADLKMRLPFRDHDTGKRARSLLVWAAPDHQRGASLKRYHTISCPNTVMSC